MNEQNQPNQTSMINVTQNERTISLIGGSILTVFGAIIGLARRNPAGALVALIGGGLIYQGTTGHSPLYRLLGTNRAVRTNTQTVSVPQGQGEHVSAVVVINRPVEELYSIWKNFQNLPQIMSYLENVEITDDKHSRWSIKSPVGTNVSWDAEIINDVRNEVIAWRSLQNAQVANAGSVRFREAPYRKGSTEVRVTLEYVAPGQKLGVAVAKWLGKNPEQQLQDDLERFKMYIENGEFKPAVEPATEAWTRSDEGQFRVQDEAKYEEADMHDPEDVNHNM